MNMRLPEINEYVRNMGTLVDVVEVPPKPIEPIKNYIFESESAVCEIRHNGCQLKYLQELNDFYGKGTAVKSAIEEMKEYCSSEKIGADSDLEVVVIKIVAREKAVPKERENFYNKDLFDFDNNGITINISEEVVWSSKTP